MGFKYDKIFNDINIGISNGIFLPLEKLPSLRKSSIKYNCAISVVIQAYNKLESMGLIKAVEKSGYIVSPQSTTPIPVPEVKKHSLLPNEIVTNLLTNEILSNAMNKDIVPFGAAIPDETILATKKIAKHINNKLKDNPHILTEYTTDLGSYKLRTELVKYMYKKGVFIDTSDIIITNGCAEALFITLKTITTPGDTVAIETPTYFTLISILEELKLNVIEIPTSSDKGLDLTIFKQILERNKIKALVFSSVFQNPLCSVMDEKSLNSLYKIALEYNLYLIEDDIYNDCSFDKVTYKPLKSIDTNNKVIYCSSFSKTISPGLRIGWVIPGELINKVKRYKQISSLGGPAVLQEALADFLKNGCYDQHIKAFKKKIYSQTYGIRKLVEEYFPKGIKMTKPLGGYFLWIEFPEGFNSFKLYSLALQEKISIIPGPVFSVSGKYSNCIRLSCATPLTQIVIDSIIKLGSISKKII